MATRTARAEQLNILHATKNGCRFAHQCKYNFFCLIGDFGVNNVVSWLGIGIFVSCFPVGLVAILQLNLDFS